MKKIVFLFVLAAFAACVNDTPSASNAAKNGLTLLTETNPEWQYENLRLYPIVANTSIVENQNVVQHLRTLEESMKTPGFRITEQKKFGRSDDRTYNTLTVQNKSQDTIFLMSGDVVTGGNQDRVIAQDQVVMPGTVRNIEVFCVEKGRWHYSDSTVTENEKNIFAFKGYYNVASPQVRQAVQRTGNQEAVWGAVAKVTSANKAESGTQAYTALETANDAKIKRDAYLRYFEGKLDDVSNVVGMVAVCGDKVLGIDIFGHPDLFRRQYQSLLHGYVTEAATDVCASQLSDNQLQIAFHKIARLSNPTAKPTDESGKFVRNGMWIHLYSK